MPPRKGSPAELLLKKVHEKYLDLERHIAMRKPIESVFQWNGE